MYEMKASDGLKYTRLFHGPWQDPVSEHMCGALSDVEQTPYLHISQIFQRCKSNANKQDFEIKLNFTWKVIQG